MNNKMCETIEKVSPMGLSNINYSRYGTITNVTITWIRYTPKLNSKRGRFGLRNRNRKVCVLKFVFD
jgi:hypothetical protein